MSERVNIGDPVDLGMVGYVRLPDGSVVTSGKSYTVRNEGTHVIFTEETGEEGREFEGVKSATSDEGPVADEEVAEENQPPASSSPSQPNQPKA